MLKFHTRYSLLIKALLILSLAGFTPVFAADPVTEKAAAADTPAAPEVPVAIPIADVAIQAEVVTSRLEKFESQGNVQTLMDSTKEDLPDLSKEVSLLAVETRQLIKLNTQLQRIRPMEEEWADIKKRSDAITSSLTTVAVQLDADLKELDDLTAAWTATADSAKASSAPPEVTDRIKEVMGNIAKSRKLMLERRSDVLSLQSQSADIGAQTSEAQQILAEAKERAVNRLLHKDSPAIWSADFWTASAQSFSRETGDSLLGKIAIIKEYIAEHQNNFISHAMIYILLAGILLGTRSKIRQLSKTDEELNRHQKVFQKPLLTALLIALLVSTWFYPRAPREFWIVIGILSVIPVITLARHVLEKHLHPILYVVIGLYLIDKLRAILSTMPMLSRLVFLAEAIMAILFAVWILKVSRPGPNAPAWAKEGIWQVIRIISWIGLVVIIIAFGANISGHVRLSDLIGNTALSSAYIAIFLYALTQIGEGLIQGACYMQPISRLGMVKKHRPVITRHINHWLKWAAFLYWVYVTLNSLGVFQSAVTLATDAFNSSVHVGSLVLSVGYIVAFFFMIWAASTVSRFIRFVLEEEMFPKMRLARGMPYAVLTIVHYVIIVIGMVLALNALGVDMTKFTILAGAFSVGVGFGLQNIINNFVSGLILLFERPIEVGDTIEMEGITGRIVRIGIRATVVLSNAGSEVIIPNGKLISDKVINWTLSGNLRQVSAIVTVKAGVDAEATKKIMLDIAARNEQVLDTPPPIALITRRGFDAYDFELKVWTDALNSWGKVKSDLISEINDTLLRNELAAISAAAEAAK